MSRNELSQLGFYLDWERKARQLRARNRRERGEHEPENDSGGEEHHPARFLSWVVPRERVAEPIEVVGLFRSHCPRESRSDTARP